MRRLALLQRQGGHRLQSGYRDNLSAPGAFVSSDETAAQILRLRPFAPAPARRDKNDDEPERQAQDGPARLRPSECHDSS